MACYQTLSKPLSDSDGKKKHKDAVFSNADEQYKIIDHLDTDVG